MKKLQRTSLVTVLVFAVIGLVVGLIVQFIRSNRGLAPLVPPITLAATLLVIAVVLLVLAVLLRRAVKSGSRDESSPIRRLPVNPFHAVRLLAGAQASQLSGALFAGFGAGLAAQLLTRSVQPPAATWVPMLLEVGAGVVLLACGMIAEWLCRVPPDSGDGDDPAPNGEAGVTPQPPA